MGSKAVIGTAVVLLLAGSSLAVKDSLSVKESLAGEGPAIKDSIDQRRMLSAEAKASALEQLRPDLAAAQAKIEQLTKSDSDKQALLAQIDTAGKDSVTVSALGRINTPPDMMRFTMGVSAKRATVKEASQAASSAASRVIQALKAKGVRSEDIQTRWVGLGRSWNEPTYEASNSVEVKLRNLDSASETLAAAIEAGGDEVHLWGAEFILEENSKAMAAVRKGAHAAARKKAEEYAEMSSRKLGRVIMIHEGDSSPSPPITMSAARGVAASDRSIPIERGTTQQLVFITLVFQLI